MDYELILQDAIDFRERFALLKVCLEITKDEKYFIATNHQIITIVGIGNEDLMKVAFEDCELNEFFKESGVFYADVLLQFIDGEDTQADYYVIEAMQNIVEGACSLCGGKNQFNPTCQDCISTLDDFDILNIN